MTPEAIQKLLQIGGGVFEEMLRRPLECSELEMELKAAMELQDVASCREILQEKGQWLKQFKGHELTQLLDTAIHAGEAADELVGMLLACGVSPNSVFDSIGEAYQYTPMITAAKAGRLDLLKKLAAAGADVFWSSPTDANALSEILPSRARQAPCEDTPELERVREWLAQQGLRVNPLSADSRR